MSRTTPALDRQAIEVLLSALEAPRPALSAAALQSFPPQVGASLLAAGLIKPVGHEAVATSLSDHDDIPVLLTWSADHRGFGYFSPAAGWIDVPHADIASYSIDMASVMTALTAKMHFSTRSTPTVLVADHLWEIARPRAAVVGPDHVGPTPHDVGT